MIFFCAVTKCELGQMQTSHNIIPAPRVLLITDLQGNALQPPADFFDETLIAVRHCL